MEEFFTSLVHAYGLPLLVVLLFLKGSLVGKPFIPATVVIPAYAFVAGIAGYRILLLTAFTAAATTAGQLAVFLKCRRDGDAVLDAVPFLDRESGKTEKAYDYFEEHRFRAIFVANMVTGFRGLMSVPAGASGYSTTRFLMAAYPSTFVYHTVVTVVFAGSLRYLL